jgi:hypothetical protein
MIPSPKVTKYDKDPKMSVQGVADKVADVLRAGEHEFVMCNLRLLIWWFVCPLSVLSEFCGS